MTVIENLSNNFEILKNKYVGTGDADTTRWEFGTNIYRDTLASNIGHKSRLLYMSLALNQTPFETKIEFLDKMFCPCGPPPKPEVIYIKKEKKDDEDDEMEN